MNLGLKITSTNFFDKSNYGRISIIFYQYGSLKSTFGESIHLAGVNNKLPDFDLSNLGRKTLLWPK